MRNTAKDEAWQLVSQVVTAKQQLDRQWGRLHQLCNASADSQLGRAVWRPVDLLVRVTAELLGDDVGSLHWFIWENDSGKKGLEHSLPNGELIQVKTIDDLLKVMGY